MKERELEFSKDNTSSVIIDWNLKNTVSEIPFHVTFSHKSERVTVQLVNASDVFKLADIFAEVLKKNGIDCTITKY